MDDESVDSKDVWSIERTNWKPSDSTCLILSCANHTQAMYKLTLGMVPACGMCGEPLVVTYLQSAVDLMHGPDITQKDWELLCDRLVNSSQTEYAMDGVLNDGK